MSTPAEEYQQELAQSEKDHHTPTAGAMIGHIISNLAIQKVKLSQTLYYAKGVQRSFIAQEYPKIIQEEAQLFDELNQLMLDEREIVPTTTDEFKRYTMLKESGQLKYETANEQLAEAVRDFATQIMFVDRGIALAQKENRYSLANFLQKLNGWLKHQIVTLENTLGKTIPTVLTEDDED